MLVFENDYSEGAHEALIKRLAETNMEKLSGYGSDPYCESAKEKIRAACGRREAAVWFLTGGTQTNAVMIRSLLKPYEGVIAAHTGHVSIHEAGAIEYTGHKVLELPGTDGKLAAADLKDYLATFYADGNHEHMVFPGMVYLSYPTEYGTLYTKEELAAIHAICLEYHLPLYLDGARLGYALAADPDMTLQDIAGLCDAFYIGGTKVGALCGEAVVFPDPKTEPAHFLTLIKQQGALLAKGRLFGVQFDTLFTDELYLTISKNAIRTADRLREILTDKGYRFFLESPTNQIFVILENPVMERLQKDVRLSFWEKYDDSHTVVRFATSWATRMEDVEALAALL